MRMNPDLMESRAPKVKVQTITISGGIDPTDPGNPENPLANTGAALRVLEAFQEETPERVPSQRCPRPDHVDVRGLNAAEQRGTIRAITLNGNTGQAPALHNPVKTDGMPHPTTRHGNTWASINGKSAKRRGIPTRHHKEEGTGCPKGYPSNPPEGPTSPR